MNDLKNCGKKIDIICDGIELIFKITFLLYSLAFYNSFFFAKPILSIFVALLTGMGGILILYRLINWKHFINNKVLIMLLVFLLSYFITTALNLKYGISTQLKTGVWMAMHFLLLFATDNRKDKAYYKKQINILFIIFEGYVFIANIISLLTLVTKYSKMFTFVSGDYVHKVLSGFYWGRLWGVYTDPNYASVFTVISAIISLYFAFNFRKISIIILSVISNILNLLYLTFSDSRTGLVTMFICIGILIYLLLTTIKISLPTFLKSTFCIFTSVVFMLGCVTLTKGIKSGYNSLVQIQINKISYDENITVEELEAQQAELEEEILGREQDIENDISNRRFDLWDSSIEVFLKKPLFGVGFNNLMQFTEENLPENYLVNNDNGKFNNYHNVLFNILAGQGIFGFITFVALAAYAGIKAVKILTKKIKGEERFTYIFMFPTILATLCGSMFLSDLIYVNSPETIIFWCVLGLFLFEDKSEIICQK